MNDPLTKKKTLLQVETLLLKTGMQNIKKINKIKIPDLTAKTLAMIPIWKIPTMRIMLLILEHFKMLLFERGNQPMKITPSKRNK